MGRRQTPFERDFADLHGEPPLIEMAQAPQAPHYYRRTRPMRSDPMPGASISARLAVASFLTLLIVVMVIVITGCLIVAGFLLWAVFQ